MRRGFVVVVYTLKKAPKYSRRRSHLMHFHLERNEPMRSHECLFLTRASLLRHRHHVFMNPPSLSTGIDFALVSCRSFSVASGSVCSYQESPSRMIDEKSRTQHAMSLHSTIYHMLCTYLSTDVTCPRLNTGPVWRGTQISRTTRERSTTEVSPYSTVLTPPPAPKLHPLIPHKGLNS